MLAHLRKYLCRFGKALTRACSSLITAEAAVTLFPYMPPDYPHTHYSKRPHIRLHGERIYSVFYDAGTRTLEVRYSDGDLRWYGDVSEGVYEALLRADRPDEALTQDVFSQDRSRQSTCRKIP
jgi:hypothetical protein